MQRNELLTDHCNETKKFNYIGSHGNRVGNFDWMHLAQDGNQWRAGVKTAMNLRVP